MKFFSSSRFGAVHRIVFLIQISQRQWCIVGRIRHV